MPDGVESAVASLERIRTDGFRRWYERQLIESHSWLLSGFLGLIVLVSGVELLGSGQRGLGVVLLLAGLAVTVASWRRYRLMLEVAESLGAQATCPHCETYGRFSVASSGPAPLPDGDDPALEDRGGGVWLSATCSRCGNGWTLTQGAVPPSL